MNKKKKKKFSFSKSSFIIIHLALGLINFVLFYVIQNSYSFIMAFIRRKDGVEYFTFDNFRFLWQDLTASGSQLIEALRNTFMWFLISIILTIIGIFTSYFLYKKIRGYKIYRVIFYLPGLISAVVIAAVVSKMLSPRGVIANLVKAMNHLDYVPDLLIDSRYALKTLIGKTFAFGIAGGMLIWCGTMSRIPDSVIESAKIDGVNWIQELFLIIIPMILPTVGISLCTSLAGLFAANGGEFLYTKGDNGTMTISTWLYLKIYNTTTDSLTHNLAAAAGWIITILTIPLVLISRNITRKLGEVEY